MKIDFLPEGCNSLLIFDNGKKMPLYSYGKKGIFCGYLNFVNGFSNLSKIQEEYAFKNCKMMFAFNDVCIGFDNIISSNQDCCEHNIYLTQQLPDCFDEDENYSFTIAKDFFYDKLLNLLEIDTINKCQFVRCVLYFPDENDTYENIDDAVRILPKSIYEFNFLKNYHINKPFALKKQQCFNIAKNNKTSNCNNDCMDFFKLKVRNSNKTIGLIDFGVSKSTLNILQQYWNIVVLPYQETAKRVQYLKIDGIVICGSFTGLENISDAVKDEILKMIECKIPVLGIGFGGYLLAKILNFNVSQDRRVLNFNSFIVKNSEKKNFVVSNLCSYKLDNFHSNNNIKTLFFDDKYDEVFGMKYKNNLCYMFDIMENNLDTERILNIFETLMHDKKK